MDCQPLRPLRVRSRPLRLEAASSCWPACGNRCETQARPGELRDKPHPPWIRSKEQPPRWDCNNEAESRNAQVCHSPAKTLDQRLRNRHDDESPETKKVAKKTVAKKAAQKTPGKKAAKTVTKKTIKKAVVKTVAKKPAVKKTLGNKAAKKTAKKAGRR